MFFLLADGLDVFRSVERAVADMEPIDAEDWFQTAYDDAGVRYEVQWVERPSRNRYGSYELIAVRGADPGALLRLLEMHRPSWTTGEIEQRDLDDLITALRAELGVVD